MFWAGRDDLAEIRSMVDCGQLGVGPDLDLDAAFMAQWKSVLAMQHFRLATVVCSFHGESYADIPAVEASVGFIPHATRTARERRAFEVSDFAAALGVASIACHAGFIPDDRTDPDYIAVRDVVRRVCDHAASHGQNFALETGQEPAEVLLRFLEDAGRGNLKINFDPANMILYGSGDPIAAFEALAPYVVSVHAKDGDPPPAAFPGQLGIERPLGQGSVGIPRFIEALRHAGYNGGVNVEREIEDQRQRMVEIRAAVEWLRTLI